MVTEEGVIEKTRNQKALVRIKKRSACTRCDSRSSCGVDSGKRIVVEVANNVQAKVGDRVEVSVPVGSLLKLSLFVYILPVVALIIGAYLGEVCAQFLHLRPSVSSIAMGALGMGITFCLLKLYDRSSRADAKYSPHITRIIFSVESPQYDDNR